LNKNYTPLTEPVLRKIDSIFRTHPAVNSNLAHLLLLDFYIDADDEVKVDKVYSALDFDRLKEGFRTGSPIFQQSFSYRLERLSQYFALKGRRDDALKVIQHQNNQINRIKSYSTASLRLLRGGSPGPKGDAFIYLDSALTEYSRIEDFFLLSQDPRIALVLTPAMIGGAEMSDLSRRLVREINLGQQSGVIQNLIMGTAIRGDYYEAYSSIPEIALIDRMFYFNIMLTVEGLRQATDPEWKTYFSAFQDYWIFFVIGFEPELF
jgi:hypothetical protein